jgi:ABC-type methionine transport system permease subunit
MTMGRDLLIMFGAFVLASALAGALGAANLGTALAFGQMAFAASVVYVLLKR